MFRILVVCLTLATAGLAQTNVLPVTIVTAARLPEETIPLDRFPGNVSIVTPYYSPSLPDLLQHQVGLVPIDTVGFGQFGNIVLRGYGERSGALILVDG